MGIKRSADELDTSSHRPRRPTTKRTKLSPTTEHRASDSTPPSSGSVSEASALQSSPPVSDHTRKTSLSSIQSSPDNSYGDSESSRDSSSASASQSASEVDEDEIITLGAPAKPRMMQSSVTSGSQDLRSRLEALLPQIAASNELLMSSGDGGVGMSIEDVEEGEQHIEMNLGLGVLEEKRGNGEDSSEGEDLGDSEGEDEAVGDAPTSSGAIVRAWQDGEVNVMDTLLGRPKQQCRRPGLEDLG